mmetsp:Transcript_17282/g.25355  ORF Transcript_17282/g.25355 Transcript_17282/m.25355 type:complete len:81 (+) Transcript_17282:792-1034(+)
MFSDESPGVGTSNEMRSTFEQEDARIVGIERCVEDGDPGAHVQKTLFVGFVYGFKPMGMHEFCVYWIQMRWIWICHDAWI